MPRNITEAVMLIVFAIICVAGIIVLTATNHDAPGVLSDLAFVAIGGGAGVARQTTVRR